MDWIKRNLMFVIGGVVTLVLMGVAGWYCYSGWSNNAQRRDEITAAYDELKQLYAVKPAPGDGKKVDNIKQAREQQKEAAEFLQGLGGYLREIPAIPTRSNVSGPRFSAALQETISLLQREATNNSVILPPGYKFSFSKQASLVTFAPGSLDPLAVQLGEVKAICDVLNEAKVNSLEGIRRERVPGSPDDLNGPATDYVTHASTTNELAIVSPYEVSFQCFTPELAAVLAGFARSPYGLIVRAINVEPATTALSLDGATPPAYGVPAPGYAPAPGYPPGAIPGYRPMGGRGVMGEEGGAAMAARYGAMGGRMGNPYQQAQPVPQVAPAQPVAYAAPAGKSGLQAFLKEKQLKVTLLVHVVKLLPAQK